MVFDITKNELTFHTAIHKYIFLYTQLKKKKETRNPSTNDSFVHSLRLCDCMSV